MDEKTLEKLGLKEDPFDIRNPSQKLIGEDDQEKKLTKFISQGKAILLHGQTGSGKTTMITNISGKINDDSIEELKGCKCIFYGDKDNLRDFSRKLWKHRLFSFGKPLIVMLDEIAFGNEDDVMMISAAWDKQKIKSVVYVQISETPKFDKLWRRIGDFKVEMRLISEKEIYEMLKLRQGDLKIFDDNALRYVSYNCGNSPSLALQRCSWIADELGKHNQAVSLEEVKQFYQQNLRTAPMPKLKEPVDEPDSKDPIDKLSLFPLERDIVRQLHISPMTMKQLSDALKNNINTISSRISNLRKQKKVFVLDKKRPQKYSLTSAFERSLLTDVKENTSNKKVENK